MEEDRKAYESEDIIVYFYPNRCNHIAECVDGLPEVFDSDRKPWVCPGKADADAVAETVERCPTGALQYRRKDGGENEEYDGRTVIQPKNHGPFFVHGEIEVRNEEGEVIAENIRVALCRCGWSKNQPICDGSHKEKYQ